MGLPIIGCGMVVAGVTLDLSAKHIAMDLAS